jgi:hypothetical protein
MRQPAATPNRLPAPGQTPGQMTAIATEAEATAVMVEIRNLMVELCDIVEEETALVRAGRLTSAGKVAERKSELARAFINNASRVRASAHYLAGKTPKLLNALRQQHEQFRAKLQINLTVLATARAVSESILRGVSDELARRSTVQTYGASGRHQTQARRPSTPIAVSRSL